MPKMRVAQIAPEGATNGQRIFFNTTTNEWEIATPPGVDFGLDQQFVEEVVRTTTTLAAPGVLKLSLVTPALTGLYRVAWVAHIDNNGATGEFRLQDTTGAAVTLSGPFTKKAGDASDIIFVGGFVRNTFIGATKTFSIQFNDLAGGNTQGIREARIEFWKVGP